MTTDAPTVMKSRGGSIQSNLLPDAPIAEKISTQRKPMSASRKYFSYWGRKTHAQRVANYHKLLDLPNKDGEEWEELLVLERLIRTDEAMRTAARQA